MQNQVLDQKSESANTNDTQLNSVISGWISYIALGTFRLDDGQSIEALYPPNSVTQEEKKSIAMISFPDTQSLNQSNDLMLEYCFRMKIRECQQLGFVFFYRKKDPSMNRGFIQKSIVIITKLPMINFYQQILNYLGEMFYEQNISSDELINRAIGDIQSWPEPENSKLYKLEFLGQKYTVSIPQYLLKDMKQFGSPFSSSNSSPLRVRPEIQTNNPVVSNYTSNRNQLLIKSDSIDESGQQEINKNLQISQSEPKIKHQVSRSVNDQDFRLKNNLKIFENKYENEDNQQIIPNFFSAKYGTSNKIVFPENDSIQQLSEMQNKETQDLEIRSKQRSNSLETQQDFSLSRQIKQKANLTEILKLNDTQEEGLFQEINVFRHVQFSKLHSLWPIWEMILVNQPFLLTANTPSECSAAILGFISLISPIQFAGDYRPYFTVYDTEYKKINQEYEQNKLKSYVLGTCNPLFQMTMKNFPVVIGFDSKSEQLQQQEAKKSKKPIQAIKYNRTKIEITPDNKQLEKLLLHSTTPEAMAINNTLVRKHFRVLTNLFIEPINKYLEEQANQVKIFEEKSFLAYLKKKKSPIQHLYKEKSQLIHLYERFIRSMNFLVFIKSKTNVVYQNPIKK